MADLSRSRSKILFFHFFLLFHTTLDRNLPWDEGESDEQFTWEYAMRNVYEFFKKRKFYFQPLRRLSCEWNFVPSFVLLSIKSCFMLSYFTWASLQSVVCLVFPMAPNDFHILFREFLHHHQPSIIWIHKRGLRLKLGGIPSSLLFSTFLMIIKNYEKTLIDRISPPSDCESCLPPSSSSDSVFTQKKFAIAITTRLIQVKKIQLRKKPLTAREWQRFNF